MNIVLFDDRNYKYQLLPLSYTRPIANFRIGILTIKDKWQYHFPKAKISFLADSTLDKKYPSKKAEDNYFINASALPTESLVNQISALSIGESLSQAQDLIAQRAKIFSFPESIITLPHNNPILEKVSLIKRPWDIFLMNKAEIKKDFDIITKNRVSAPVNDPFTKIYHPENVFLEEGATIRASIINASSGPVYIGKNATVCEGSFINGSFALCHDATVNPHGNMRGDTTIGPFCKVGGEISNSVIFGYSNKGHEGFLGNSVMGEWCNLGAGTNSSNLKNNYSSVRIWDYPTKSMIDSGLQFCGLIMGDHSKSAIGTTFNTGTTVGVFSNIFSSGFPPKFMPSFTWGGNEDFTAFKMNKAIEMAANMMKRRGITLSDDDISLFKSIENLSLQYKSES